MKKLLALAAALAALFFLNPSESDHRARFAESFRAGHPVLSFFGADRVAPVLLTYRSYGVLSVGRVGEQVVTVGAGGYVRVRDLDLERLVEDASRS
ncbi:MAG TPA: hypothetical protein VF263_23380 [Longimicrobiaceae bacterium]